MHGLNGYKEVIETVAWGLEQLGHRATYAVNEIASDATNIVFGAQVMPITAIRQLPNNTIIYNFEQMRGVQAFQLREEIRCYAQMRQFRIWEYSDANLPTWRDLGRHDVKIVPVGYAPILNRIPKAPRQDIDVLIYGLSGERRLQLFHALSTRGLSILFVSGLYGSARDDLISRSKVVLNINLYSHARIFEIVRVSYLLANKKAVVADLDLDTITEGDMRTAVKFGRFDQLTDICLRLVENESERGELEELGFSAMSKRNIVDILNGALAAEAA